MAEQMIDKYRIISSKQLVKAIKEGKNNSQRFCFILGSGASASSNIPVGGELERRWMRDLEEEPGFSEVHVIAENMRKDNLLEYDFKEIEAAWQNVKDTTVPLPSKYYFDIYKLRFFPNHRNGYHYLEKMMADAKPSFGYHPLALMLTHESGNNLVITTNFDSLVEDALFMYTDSKPLVINHELLADFAGDPNIRRPIIAKVHRGIFFDPLNSPEETNELKGKWHDVLESVFQSYTPIVIGYGGGDHSLMELLAEENIRMKNGIYWCYVDEYGLPDEKIQKLVQQKNGYLVYTASFDAIMLAIGNALFPDKIGVHETEQYLTNRISMQIENYGKEYARLTQYENKKIVSDSEKGVNPSEEDFKEEIEKIATRGTASESEREKSNQMTAWDYQRQGMRYYDSSDYMNAIKSFSNAISKQPDTAIFYIDRSYAYINLYKFEKALSDLDIAIKLGADMAQVYTSRAFTYCCYGKYEQALSDIKKAIELNPNDAQAYNICGLIYSYIDEYEKSVSNYDKAIKLNPNDVQAYNNRGFCYHYIRKYERALSDYNKAVALKPSYAAAYSNRGYLYNDMGEYNKALRDYNKVIKLKPDYKVGYANRGKNYHDMGEYEKALSDYNKAIELDPDFSVGYSRRGITYLEIGEYEKALCDFNKAIELNSKYKDAYLNRAKVYHLIGEDEKAAADEETAAKL